MLDKASCDVSSNPRMTFAFAILSNQEFQIRLCRYVYTYCCALRFFGRGLSTVSSARLGSSMHFVYSWWRMLLLLCVHNGESIGQFKCPLWVSRLRPPRGKSPTWLESRKDESKVHNPARKKNLLFFYCYQGKKTMIYAYNISYIINISLGQFS